MPCLAVVPHRPPCLQVFGYLPTKGNTAPRVSAQLSTRSYAPHPPCLRYPTPQDGIGPRAAADMAARDISGVVAASGRREEVQAGYWAAVGYTPPGGPAALAEDGSDEQYFDSESYGCHRHKGQSWN